jgi:hypothetical protein
VEKVAAHGVRAGNVGALAIFDSFAPTVKKQKLWMKMMHLDLLTP